MTSHLRLLKSFYQLLERFWDGGLFLYGKRLINFLKNAIDNSHPLPHPLSRMTGLKPVKRDRVFNL